jgi:hypothetical protein
MNSIFVQIASYRDPQLLNTLNDLIGKSKNPQNLHVCICWQHGEEQSLEDFLENDFLIGDFRESDLGYNVIEAEKNGSKITILDINHFDTKGACWARNQIQQYYNKEKYTLQLDSHHRFVDGWDDICIDMLEELRKDSPKPLITAYLPSFNPENDPAGRVNIPWKMDFDRFIPEGAVFFRPSSIDEWKSLSKPVKARFYSAHFAFADGSFAEEVQHDPEYFFHGEEISISVRAFTHGYDLYHPHILVAWHEYTRVGRTKVWDDHVTTNKKKGKIDLDWVERNNLCHKRNRILFGMDGEDPNQIDFGKYGFGSKRTVRQYEEYAGISFEHRGVQQETLDKKYPPNNLPYTTEEEWKNTFTKSNDVRILIHKTKDLDPSISDYDFWYVGAHDENGEIFRKDYTASEIQKYLKQPGEWIDNRLIFLSNRIPKTYVIWPHSKSKNWLNRIEKNV